jgi:hypothetical protein
MTPNAEIILANNNASQAPGAIELSFTSGNKIPDGGQLTISFPDLFTAADIPDLLDVGGVNYLTTFTDDGLDILPNVTAASLENNVLTITFDAVISTDSQLNLVLADGVIDQNPDSSGQFGISLLTKDQSGSPLGTGIVSAKIGDGVGLRAVVQEALILTTNNNEVNLVVDPSVNLGRDISQTTTLTVATNAPSYNIEAKLVNTQTTNSSLYNTDSGTEIFSSTYAAANNNENYFGFSLGTPFTASTFAESTFSSTGTNLFSSPAAGITNAQNYTIYYDLNVDFLTQAGKYEGMIYYTAVPTF